MKMYAIFDSKTLAYLPPFTSPQHGSAIRVFTDAAIDDQTAIGNHPEDYTLFYLANYDENTGIISPLDTPHALVKGNEVVIPTQEIE